MKAPELIHTSRLTLRKPAGGDAEAIFRRYASDPVVTRYLSWATHRTVADTRAFLAWSHADWERWPAGSYLVFSMQNHGLLGGTGLSFTSPTQAVTGYVFAEDAWGYGYATESLQAMVALARQTGVARLEAICHVDHRASSHVLEKCGFEQTEIRRSSVEFPNLAPGRPCDVFCYVKLL
jgi:RimJ/RimL family protein N-acetyltransferase